MTRLFMRLRAGNRMNLKATGIKSLWNSLDISTLSGSIASLQTTVSGIQGQITSLDARITALESKNATT